MRTPPASSSASAASMVAAGAPRLPPGPSRTSGTAAALDSNGDMGEDRIDRGGGLAQLDRDAFDGREARENRLRDGLGRGLDQAEPALRQRLRDERDQGVVADRLPVIV